MGDSHDLVVCLFAGFVASALIGVELCVSYFFFQRVIVYQKGSEELVECMSEQ